MLVLTRKRQEQVRIGDNITLTVLRIKGNTVRVGIEAPRDVRVVRGELPPKDSEVALEVVHEDSESDHDSESKMEEQVADSDRLHQLVKEVTASPQSIANAV